MSTNLSINDSIAPGNWLSQHSMRPPISCMRLIKLKRWDLIGVHNTIVSPLPRFCLFILVRETLRQTRAPFWTHLLLLSRPFTATGPLSELTMSVHELGDWIHPVGRLVDLLSPGEKVARGDWNRHQVVFKSGRVEYILLFLRKVADKQMVEHLCI